jgi:hypothetical protein
VEKKRITEPQFCLQNSKIKWVLCTLIHKQSVIQENLMLEGNNERLILHTGAGGVIVAHFESDTAILKKKLVFLHDYARAHCTMTMDSFVGNGGMMETIHPPFSPRFRIIFSFRCNENRPPAKKISKNRGYVESVRRIKCNFFECLG